MRQNYILTHEQREKAAYFKGSFEIDLETKTIGFPRFSISFLETDIGIFAKIMNCANGEILELGEATSETFFDPGDSVAFKVSPEEQAKSGFFTVKRQSGNMVILTKEDGEIVAAFADEIEYMMNLDKLTQANTDTD